MSRYKDRSAALAAGVSKYWSREKCKNGHYSYRWTLSGACVECQTARRKAQAEKYKAAKLASQG